MQSSAVLRRQGHQVDIVSLDKPNDPWVQNSLIEVNALGPGQGKYGYTARFRSWIEKHREEYDAVIVQGLWQYNSLGVWQALRGSKIPYFVFPHGMLDPWFKRTYRLKHLKKSLYWLFGEYRVLRDAAGVLFTSDEERRSARESFWLYQCNELVVNYGTSEPEVDLAEAREAFFESFPQLRDQPFLLFLGRLHEKKGCEMVIRGLANIREHGDIDSPLQLVIAGPDPKTRYVKRLKGMAAQLDGVTFTGMLSGSQKWGALSAADAFILPSHQENFGIAVVEALACGTPVLISNKVNIWREIAAEQAGYVEEDTLGGTARLIERWIGTSRQTRWAMKLNARRCFARHFEINRATASLLRVLETARAKQQQISETPELPLAPQVLDDEQVF